MHVHRCVRVLHTRVRNLGTRQPLDWHKIARPVVRADSGCGVEVVHTATGWVSGVNPGGQLVLADSCGGVVEKLVPVFGVDALLPRAQVLWNLRLVGDLHGRGVATQRALHRCRYPRVHHRRCVPTVRAVLRAVHSLLLRGGMAAVVSRRWVHGLHHGDDVAEPRSRPPRVNNCHGGVDGCTGATQFRVSERLARPSCVGARARLTCLPSSVCAGLSTAAIR